MAVILCKSDGEALPVSADLRNAPQVRIEGRPPLAISHQGKRIKTRSETQYACAEQESGKEAFKRRRVQQTLCGFHGPPSRPYREVGEVVLDDRRLILEGLGQLEGSHEQLQVEEPPSPGEPQAEHSLPVVVPTGRVHLRARTTSQFPTELFQLDTECRFVEKRLDLVRKGHGLFKLMSDHREAKKAACEQAVLEKADALRSEWKEAEVAPDIISLDGTDRHDDDQHTATPSEARQSSSSTTSEVPTGALDETEVASGDDGAAGEGKEGSEGDREEQEKREQGTEHCSDTVDQWFRQLCVLLWVLEAIQMESPAHMPELAQYLKINRPPANETVGKRVLERNKALLQQWDSITRQPKKPAIHSKGLAPGNPRRLRRGDSRQQSHSKGIGGSPDASPTANRGHLTSHDSKTQTQQGGGVSHPLTQSKSPKKSAEKSPSHLAKSMDNATQKLPKKQQKRLTATEKESLLTLLEEELNYSKKQSRSRIKAFQRETDQLARTQVEATPRPHHFPPVTLNASKVSRRFTEAEEGRKMIVHEQLSAMDRDRQKALEQRFSHLEVSGNLWQDLAVMREGVEIESTSMARKKLLMNYNWYSDLLSLVPAEARDSRYCQQLLVSLGELAQHTYTVGPKMLSKRKLIQVLGSLKPWELRSPEISAAVEFVITKVIYVVTEDYDKWLEQHTAFHQAKLIANSSPTQTSV